MCKKLIIAIGVVLLLSMPVLADINFNVQFNFTGTGPSATATATPGGITINAFNTDAAAMFSGSGGDIFGMMEITSTGPYLDTDVEVSGTDGATLTFSGFQNLSGYTNNAVVVQAGATGATSSDMNLRFDNSNYVVQLERYDSGADFLSASGVDFGIGYGMWIAEDVGDVAGTSSAGVAVSINDDGNGGAAAIDTGQWFPTATGSYGWGNPDGITAPSPPGYYTPTNTVSGSGSGVLSISAFGDNFLGTATNIVMPEGGSFGGGVWNFTDTFSGTYTLTAN